MAILELGITAALSAAGTNWLDLAPRPKGGQGGLGGGQPPQERGVPGGRPPGLTLPPDQRDETDDAHGHRIYVNPWAADE